MGLVRSIVVINSRLNSRRLGAVGDRSGRRATYGFGYSARMEPFPGVFVSSVSAEAWEPDPEVGGEMHVLCSGHGAESGMSRFTEVTGPVRWTLPGRETLLVLEGAARIDIDDGPVLELTAGDMASLPAGARTTWYLTTPFREFWVITEQAL